MKKYLLIATAVFGLTAFTTVFTEVWKNDPPHSRLQFTVTHLGINDITGSFNDFSVTVHTEKPDFSDAVFELNAKTASIDTRVEARDAHLKSADFFDAATYPALTFKSNKIEQEAWNKFKLTGDLTMHGITKSVTMDLLYKGRVENPMNKKPTIGFQLTGSLKRSDFKIGEKFGEAMISDVVRIKADGEFTQ
ncbi:YceI family protein [Nostoc ellipsosporum NOK]|jgi:polyisoprenoid-binding protein YceI|nr:YceI family protein [Nostoc ellipsosporum NOK]